jgi:hypothetical protein
MRTGTENGPGPVARGAASSDLVAIRRRRKKNRMNGTTIDLGRGYVGQLSSEWQTAGIGDGRSGVLWRDTTTRGIDIWNMNGTRIAAASGYTAWRRVDVAGREPQLPR